MSPSENENRKVFSIILATYNCGRKVEATIESVLSQNKDLFELIVVDGASTDDTLSCIKKYEASLRLISEKDDGVYEAFNKGINLASGKFLYFIGAGDHLREGVLAAVNDLLPATDAPAFVYGDAMVAKEQIRYGGKFSELRLATQNLCHQAVFYDRRIFELLGEYETRYKIFADWTLNLKCFGAGSIEKRHIELVIADYEGGGLSSSAEDPDFKKAFPLLIKNNLGIKSYVFYKAATLFPGIYWKIYFPFVRPLISSLKRRKNA